MLWTIITLILIIWLIGLVLEIAGGLIHLLLVIAGIIFIYQLLTGKRSL
ncbi:lmo0937 family membrane protein [Alkalibacillus haloalkaliphilus]|nr:lmo0937 family membrane protein [Alkalibacillus haloalkaliphilus]